ncbi:1371_t:CDS:2 [Diversispora eburnea]|uniref:1371_t:CDS:1 n=1 Tax=Diversispora eburnea TaxID=1213867 RepID=A0A9N8V4I2_9GLOM|nr:1371_t:CDS:2 [Diversispora eburnea]
MFFSETLLQEPSNKQTEEKNWTEVASPSRFKSRKSKHPRKKQRTNSQEYDLLVFGYEAKTFRDDDMSKKVNDGELLISWRGETENKILLDRYDVRNLLDEREQFRKVSYTMSKKNEEIEQEKIIDEERWKDLDSEAEDLFEMSEEERYEFIEEKKKRKREKDENEENEGYSYNYDYNEEFQPYEEVEEVRKVKSQYVPKYSVPLGMVTPLDNRVDEIIERTAKFLNASTDPQMEIVIQAKQANNPSFSFLNKEDPLYPYYRHVRVLLQTGLFAYGDNEENRRSTDGEKDNKTINLTDGKFEGNNYKIQDDSKIEENSTPREKKNSSSIKSKKIQHGAIIIPPPDLKAIIDKMSAYVAKNGLSLEAKVREKHIDDPRFSFLLPWNEFHPYYKKKILEEKSTNSLLVEADSTKTNDS